VASSSVLVQSVFICSVQQSHILELNPGLGCQYTCPIVSGTLTI